MKDFVRKTKAVLEEFERRDDLSNSTITLDGAGINSAVQYIVLSHFGPSGLRRFKRINIISGSFIVYAAIHANETGDLLWDYEDVSAWDPNFRKWHRAGLGSLARFALKGLFRGGALYGNDVLRLIYEKTFSSSFTQKTVSELPPNAVLWLYEPKTEQLVPVSHDSEFRDQKIIDVWRCAPAIPQIYGVGELKGRKFIDPVFCTRYRELLKKLREESGNHLIANFSRTHIGEKDIFLKTHNFGKGRSVLLADLFRLAMNLPNPRPKQATDAAFNLKV